MTKLTTRRSAMPMNYLRRNLHYIAGLQQLYRLTLFLVITFAGCAQKNLTAGMTMPVISAARFKGYIPNRAIKNIVRYQHLKPGRACKIIVGDLFAFGKNIGIHV